jgi:hypothetical protein
MRPPGFPTALIGHPVIALPIFVGAVAVGYLWLAGELTGWAALGALVLAACTAKASDQVNKYRAFKREWDGMGGGSVARQKLRVGGLRYIFGIAAWLFMAALAIDVWNDPGLKWMASMFWLATAIILGTMSYRLLRSDGRSQSAKAFVRVCLPIAKSSPAHHSAAQNLPSFCILLIE